MPPTRRPRRARGEGSITYRADRACFQAQTPRLANGRRLCAYFDTEAEAREWLDDQLARIRRGYDVTGAREPLGEYLLRWLDMVHPVRDGERASSTRQTYLCRIGHVDEVHGLAERPLGALRPDHFQEFVAHLKRTGRSALTIRFSVGTLQQALEDAVRFKLIAENPVVVKIAKDAAPPFRPPVWALDDVNEFLAWRKAEADPFHAAWRLGFAHGPRISQIVSLQWERIDFARRRIDLGFSLSGRGKRLQANKQRREHWIEAAEPVLAALAELPRRGPWVFAKSELAPWGHEYVRSRFVAAVRAFRARRAERMRADPSLRQVPLINTHSMRHTAATIMLENGYTLPEVSQILGHSSVAITARMYGHVTPKRPRENADRLGRLMP